VAGEVVIETPRLRLIPCELRHFEAILAADRGRLGRMLGVAIPDDGFDFPGSASVETMRSLHEHLKANPDALGWWTYLFVHAGDRMLIGQGGYKGRAMKRAWWRSATR
jgi:[ribosomal protein S5]-alanine N-acetyltransferase